MKKSIIILLLIVSFCHLSLKDTYTSPIQSIESQFYGGISNFMQSTSDLKSNANGYLSDKVSIEELKKSIDKARNSYKQIEFLFDYLDPETANKYVNGAPLPKVEPHVSEILIQKPVGLQTLDELIYLDPKNNKEEIADLAIQLDNLVKKRISLIKSKELQHRYIIEAIRYGVIRVFTLGVTGFDTPGSGNAIPESIISMEAMYTALKAYKQYALEKNISQYDDVANLFDQSILFLKMNNDFDTFDRLTFLKDYLNPIYGKMYDLHKELQIEFAYEVDKTQSAHNYESKSIFDIDFLNASYYTQIAKNDLENPKIIALGEKLFYDVSLSSDNAMNCASCHDPAKGFSDGLPKSNTNKPNLTTERNSPTLLNSAYYGKYFWDMREYDLARQIKHVVHNANEFNIDFLDLVDKLKENEDYVNSFSQAYGDRDKYGISTWSISNSLAAYVSSLSSWDSPFDKYVNNTSNELSESAKRGFNLFMGKAACGTCHFAPTFSGTVPPFYQDSESEVLGITTSFDTINPVLDSDLGRIVNGIVADEAPFMNRAFKTVTVRNVELTGPYMHNGSLNTLQEVIHFYNHGGGAGLGLDVPNQTLPDTPLGLSKQEMIDIEEFMVSLSDPLGY